MKLYKPAGSDKGNFKELYSPHYPLTHPFVLDAKMVRPIHNGTLKSSAQDPDPLDSQDFGFFDPDPQKYADPRIRIQGAKYQPKTAKKKFHLKT